MLFAANLSAQNRRPTNATNVVAAFGFECQTTQFPRTKLPKAIRAAVAQVTNEGSSGNGERAVGYDLDGDGVKEYFVALRDMGIGDNYVWGIFAVKPVKFLGIIRAEHIYILKRRGKWPALTAHWHESVSDSYISTLSFRNGRYRRNRGGYLASVYKKNEPEYSKRTTELYLCDRNIN